MGRSYGPRLEQYPGGEVAGGDIVTSNDYIDLQGDYPTFEYQIISDIKERKVALKIVAKQLKITSGDPEYTILREAISKYGIVPKDLEENPTYDINEARKWYGLSKYVPPVESPNPEDGNELGETLSHEITWQKPRNEKNGEPDIKQQPGHIRLTNNEFNNELTPKKGDKESDRDPSTYIIPTFGRLLGIPEEADKESLEYNLRVAIAKNDRNIPEELQNNELTPENINIWRQKIGLETLSSEQTEQTEVIDPEIEARIQAYPYLEQTKSATTDDYIRARNYLSDWLLIADDLERDNLVRGIQATGIMPKLTDLPNYELIKAQQKNGDISGEYLNFINATRELYGLPAYGTSGEVPPEIGVEEQYIEETKVAPEIAGKQEIIVEDSIPLREDGPPINKKVIYRNRDEGDKGLAQILNKYFPEDKPDSQGEETTLGVPPEQETGQDEIPSVLEGDPVDPKLAQILAETTAIVEQEARKDNGGAIVKVGQSFKPDLELMYQQLDNYISQEEGGKLARIEGREYPGEEDRTEINLRKQKAKEAIEEYQQFRKTNKDYLGNAESYNEYRKFEEKAWFHVGRFIHQLGGEITTLQQERDIQLSHPEVVNIRDYLANGDNFILDTNDNITHLNINGNIIELNRPRTIDELLNASRPTHILYHSGTPISEDDLTKQQYEGLLIPSLNDNTLTWIEGVLSDKQFLEAIIVDDSSLEQKSPQSTEIDMSEYKSLGLSDEQLSRIKGVIVWANQENINELTVGRLKNYTDGTFDADQAREIFLGFHQGLNDEEVAQYANSDMTVEQMKAKRNELVQAKNSVSKEELATTEETSPGDEKATIAEVEVSPEDKLKTLRVAYAKAEELYNRNRRDEDAKFELERLREEYNQEVENILMIKVAEGLESEIHAIFTQEVKALRDERIVQSQELQSGFEKAINPLKEKFVNFAIKHKKVISTLNLVAFGVGTTLALTGFGLPVVGGLAVLRRSVSSLMSGVSSRELARAGFEDGSIKINKFGLNINFQAAIPKLVGESLQEGYIKGAKDADLSTKLSTLEAYYRLNGGRFTNASQQEAYEAILTELGSRVQHESIANQAEKEVSPTTQEIKDETITLENNNEAEVQAQPEKFAFSSPEYNQQYASRLLTVLSKERISELQKQQQKRKTADIIGFATGGSLFTIGSLLDAHRAAVIAKPSTTDALQESTGTPKSTPQPSVETAPPAKPPISEGTGTGATTEATKAAAQNLSPEQLQDISQLSEGETLWKEVAEKLGANATDAQIQQGVEAYMGTSQGQETMFSLARQTEGGRALLSQWGIDNAGELSQVSKTDLYELSRHLGVGQLKGLDSLDLSNLPPLDEVSTSTGFNPAESTSSGVTPPGPGAESLPQVDENVFMSEAAKTLGIDNANLTETEFTNIMYSYLETEQGRDALYNLTLSDESRKILLEQQFGVYSIEDFNRLSPTELYNLSQSVDIAKLEGFNLDNIILSKFENAPDSISLIKGAGPLTQVNQYIDMYAGGLPYDSTLGQAVLTTYLQTEEGKNWLYDAIVNNPDSLNGNQGIQIAKEYLRQKGIQKGTDIDWTLLNQDKKFPTSIFWRETTLTGGRKLPPLSTLLKPGQMPGIKKALQLVLDKQ